MKKLLFGITILLMIGSNVAGQLKDYSIIGGGFTFSEGVIGISGSAIFQNNYLRLGGGLGISFSTKDIYMFGQDCSQFGISAGIKAGYNFGNIFTDLNLFLGYAALVAESSSYWGLNYTPFYKSGDIIANGFNFTISPQIGTIINVGNFAILPSIMVDFRWLLLTSTDASMKNLSSELSYYYGGVGYTDAFSNGKITQLGIYLTPAFSLLFNTFDIEFGLAIPLSINQELNIDGNYGYPNINQSNKVDGKVAFSIFFGYRLK